MADSCESLGPSSTTKSEDIEEENDKNSTSAWLNDWWQSAKAKSTSALEFMKRDLTEFSQVIQHDTASAVSTTTAILKERLRVDDSSSVAGRAKQGFTDLVQTVSGALYPTREPDNDQLVIIRDSQAVLLDKWQAELYLIQCDPSTFSHEAQGPPEMYEKWLEDFCLSDRQQEVDKLLLQCPEVKNIQDRLVPSSVSECEFWQRYFYRVWQLHESRRAQLVQRAQPKALREDLPWDEDDDSGERTGVPNSKTLPVPPSLAPAAGDRFTESAQTSSGFHLTPAESAATESLVQEMPKEGEDRDELHKTETEGSNISPPSCNSSDKG